MINWDAFHYLLIHKNGVGLNNNSIFLDIPDMDLIDYKIQMSLWKASEKTWNWETHLIPMISQRDIYSSGNNAMKVIGV